MPRMECRKYSSVCSMVPAIRRVPVEMDPLAAARELRAAGAPSIAVWALQAAAKAVTCGRAAMEIRLEIAAIASELGWDMAQQLQVLNDIVRLFEQTAPDEDAVGMVLQALRQGMSLCLRHGDLRQAMASVDRAIEIAARYDRVEWLVPFVFGACHALVGRGDLVSAARYMAVLKSSSQDKPQLAAVVRLVLGHISILSEEDPACNVAQIAGVLPDQLAQYAAALMLVRGPALDCSQTTWAYERLAKPLLAPSSNVTVLDGLGIPIQWATSSTVAALYALLRCIQMRSLGRNTEAASFVNLGLDLDANTVDPVLRSLLEAQSIQLILSRFDLVSAAHRLSSFVSRPDNTLIAATESLLRAQYAMATRNIDAATTHARLLRSRMQDTHAPSVAFASILLHLLSQSASSPANALEAAIQIEALSCPSSRASLIASGYLFGLGAAGGRAEQSLRSAVCMDPNQQDNLRALGLAFLADVCAANLDQGLAGKLLCQARQLAIQSESPRTIATVTGIIMGTLNHMGGTDEIIAKFVDLYHPAIAICAKSVEMATSSATHVRAISAARQNWPGDGVPSA
ncbi:unnamed protein product (mitochondrion) [Plasmodiophora brassicae]|uniref:MalT-like TPR region domain-containing protein n=1 Tax=Plasmodiophora brassicae TaxID=37360 RepID=A0A0G4J8Y7_PLABS|nr:hypothetical protein PBRA_003373 [Plasmodiophora brassicae]SPQ99722.1 unnamed protein product [Plasmodiophora brassicae]